MTIKDLFQQFSTIQHLQTPKTSYDFHYLETVASTNNHAKKYLGTTPALFLSPNQTSGRGRFNREWVSPPYSGLSFTALFSKLPFERNAGLIPILCAVAIAEAIDELYALQPDIKWPNDIYLDKGKIAGILVESVVQNNIIERFVIGIGVNLCLPESESERKELAELPTNPRFLEEFLPLIPDPFPLLKKIVTVLDKYLFTSNVDEIIQRWEYFCPHIGKKTAFIYQGKKKTGVITGLNSDGELQVNISKRAISLSSSDITFIG